MIKPMFSSSFQEKEVELKRSKTVIELNDESYRKALGIPSSARTQEPIPGRIMTNAPFLVGSQQTIEEQDEESNRYQSNRKFASVAVVKEKQQPGGGGYNLPNYFSQNQAIDRRNDPRFGDDNPDSTLEERKPISNRAQNMKQLGVGSKTQKKPPLQPKIVDASNLNMTEDLEASKVDPFFPVQRKGRNLEFNKENEAQNTLFM